VTWPNTVRGAPEKLLLIAYSLRSTDELLDYDTERRRFEQLRRTVQEDLQARPTLLILASDLHHQRLLETVFPPDGASR
jgi:hypothetical protein